MQRTSFSLLLAFFLHCFAYSQSDEPVLISLERTKCFGDCPVFTLTVYESNRAVLIGEENFNKLGEYHAAMSKSQVKQLIKYFRQNNFFELEDEYTSSASDLPTTYLSFTYKGKTKKIMDYDNAPDALKNMEAKVEELINILDWRKKLEMPTN